MYGSIYLPKKKTFIIVVIEVCMDNIPEIKIFIPLYIGSIFIKFCWTRE